MMMIYLHFILLSTPLSALFSAVGARFLSAWRRSFCGGAGGEVSWVDGGGVSFRDAGDSFVVAGADRTS
jgi:hypothetical protein